MQDNNIIQEAIDCLKRLHKENAKLKAENERLKEELTTYGATGVCEVCSDKANKLADKYLGCLQEIKAITENSCRMTDKDLCDNNSCAVCKSISDSDAIEQILQKIIKAESEEV